jgi:hypothetical protein
LKTLWVADWKNSQALRRQSLVTPIDWKLKVVVREQVRNVKGHQSLVAPIDWKLAIVWFVHFKSVNGRQSLVTPID